MHVYLIALALSTLFLVCVSAQGLTGGQIDTVQQLLALGATQSWELGTRAQALLELSTPSFSVLTTNVSLPPPTWLNSSLNNSLADVFTIAQNTVAALPPPPSDGTGQPLAPGGGSSGDPASIGVAVLIANWTNLGGEDYAGAATAQIQYLFGPSVPKTQDGAISHRVSDLQLWSDSVFMVPPLLAYYGITTSNESMLWEAYNQVKLYRSYLRDEKAGGLWQHIVLGENGTDPGHWSTGNGWAAAGMLRVLATLQSSTFSQDFSNEINDLGNWVSEIHSAMYPHQQPNGLFKNYADDNSDRNFDDAASSALLAATVYRLDLLTGNKTFIQEAELTRIALFATDGTPATPTGLPVLTATPSTPSWPSSPIPSSSGSPNAFTNTPHFTFDGWLAPVVNPRDFSVQGAQSPEAQAFALMLQSAWQDWVAASTTVVNVAPTPTHAPSRLSAALMGMAGLVVACNDLYDVDAR